MRRKLVSRTCLIALTAAMLIGPRSSSAESDLGRVLRENPKADQEFGLIRKSLELDVIHAQSEADSLRIQLMVCEAVKPAEPRFYETFESGFVAGIVGAVAVGIVVGKYWNK